MSAVIDKLQREHRDLAKLMAVLDLQVMVLHDGGAPDHGVLRAVLRYLNNYPDLLHHPKEDLVYRCLLRRDPDATALVRDILREHVVLEALTADFADLIDRHDRGAATAAAVERMARDLAALYRHHIAVEEAELFPRALVKLRDSDWAEIDAAISAVADPLFDGAATVQYHLLHKEILRLGA
jgi:hemerythrin-like domain-containing protein